MKIEMGESLIYSWLRHVKECQIVQTNWKFSSQWTLLHETELERIKEETDSFFRDNHNYNIYGNNANLMQIIRQGESDAIGISISEGKISSTYAVDVAFHENGLKYGDNDDTIMRITKKCIRTAMCLLGSMDIRKAEIIFASPKIDDRTLSNAKTCVKEAQNILQNVLTELECEFNFRIIANEEFKTTIIDPALLASEDIADTNELFLRSYQMLQMFEEK